MMKKVVSLLLALVMALGLCVNVWAEGGTSCAHRKYRNKYKLFRCWE